MLKKQLRQIVQANPEYGSITAVIEKEILHHDIMSVLVNSGVMERLTFIGGTSLRMCYNSQRLSEDLDFNGGHDFKPSDFDGLEIDIQNKIQEKYETEVWVNKPRDDRQGNTVSWRISIEREANRPDLPRQKMHIDVCAIPSFDIKMRPLINHYSIAVPTEGLLVPVQSLEETFADKFIALAYRQRRIKPRDIWDILWLRQNNVEFSHVLISKKLAARAKEPGEFHQVLQAQLDRLVSQDDVREDFTNEMRRFIPSQIQERTLDNPQYWPYVRDEILTLGKTVIAGQTPRHQFDMGM